MQIALKKRQWERTNKPGPVTYETREAFNKQSTSPNSLKTQFKKLPRDCFIDAIKAKKKSVPAPSAYNPSDRIIFKPMRKY